MFLEGWGRYLEGDCSGDAPFFLLSKRKAPLQQSRKDSCRPCLEGAGAGLPSPLSGGTQPPGADSSGLRGERPGRSRALPPPRGRAPALQAAPERMRTAAAGLPARQYCGRQTRACALLAQTQELRSPPLTHAHRRRPPTRRPPLRRPLIAGVRLAHRFSPAGRRPGDESPLRSSRSRTQSLVAACCAALLAWYGSAKLPQGYSHRCPGVLPGKASRLRRRRSTRPAALRMRFGPVAAAQPARMRGVAGGSRLRLRREGGRSPLGCRSDRGRGAPSSQQSERP